MTWAANVTLSSLVISFIKMPFFGYTQSTSILKETEQVEWVRRFL